MKTNLAETLFPREGFSLSGPQVESSLDCFENAVNTPAANSDKVCHDSFVEELDKLDKNVFGLHGSVDEYGMGLNVHKNIQQHFDANPALYRSVLYRINQSRDLFGLFPLVQSMKNSAPEPKFN